MGVYWSHTRDGQFDKIYQDHKCKFPLTEQLYLWEIVLQLDLHIWEVIYMQGSSSKRLETTQEFICRSWLNKLWYAHTVEYGMATKRKEDSICELIWKDLQDSSLNEK